MAGRIAVAIVVLAATLVATRYGRGWPWEFAGISAVLVGGLAFVTLQTFVRLRSTLQQFQGRAADEGADRPDQGR